MVIDGRSYSHEVLEHYRFRAIELHEEGKKVKHAAPMLSLDKCYDEASLLSWASKFEGDVLGMPKIDGCAVSLHYDQSGKLSRAATRGSGIEGEDITANVHAVDSIPKQLKIQNTRVLSYYD